MAEFFENDNRISVDEEIDTSSISRLNPNLTLGHIQEQQEKERATIKQNLPEFRPFDNLQNASDNQFQQFKKQGDRQLEVTRLRFKLFAVIYILITLILTGFVIYNLVATSLLSNESKRNVNKISEFNKLLDKLQQDKKQTNIKYQTPKDLML